MLSDGNIEQVGTPDEVHRHPANAFVKEFLRDLNLRRLAVGYDQSVFAGVRPFPSSRMACVAVDVSPPGVQAN